MTSVDKSERSPSACLTSRNARATRKSRASLATTSSESLTAISAAAPATTHRSNRFHPKLQYSRIPNAVIFTAASSAYTHASAESASSRASVHQGGSSWCAVAATTTLSATSAVTTRSNRGWTATRYAARRIGPRGGGTLRVGCARSTDLHISAHSFCAGEVDARGLAEHAYAAELIKDDAHVEVEETERAQHDERQKKRNAAGLASWRGCSSTSTLSRASNMICPYPSSVLVTNRDTNAR